MAPMGTLPALRTDTDLMPVRLEGRDVILVRDPQGIVAPNAALSGEVVPYLPLFNGSSTVDDLQIVMMRRQGGSLVFRSEAERIVGEFSRLGILQTEAYREAKERIVREFAASPERTAALAGNAYPADPSALAALLDRILSLPVPPAGRLPGPPCALASPHIDLRVAERTYAAAYRAIRGPAPSGRPATASRPKPSRRPWAVSRRTGTRWSTSAGKRRRRSPPTTSPTGPSIRSSSPFCFSSGSSRWRRSRSSPSCAGRWKTCSGRYGPPSRRRASRRSSSRFPPGFPRRRRG